MSAELYDAEISEALARPAVDVLPVHSRRAKPEATPEESSSSVPDISAELPEADAGEHLAGTHAAAPIAPVEPAEHQPTKVFGITLGRRRAKQTEVTEPAGDVVDASAGEKTPEAASEASDVSSDVADTSVADQVEAEVEPVAIVPHRSNTDLAPVAATVPDHTEEMRALHALLEASEQVRMAAEQRTAAAEAELRTMTNTLQEWQIRHREAEATITELAASLAGAEGRMSELARQVQEATAERDELTSQLDAATSPAG